MTASTFLHQLVLSVELGTVPERLTRLGNSNVLRLPMSCKLRNLLYFEYNILFLTYIVLPGRVKCNKLIYGIHLLAKMPSILLRNFRTLPWELEMKPCFQPVFLNVSFYSKDDLCIEKMIILNLFLWNIFSFVFQFKRTVYHKQCDLHPSSMTIIIKQTKICNILLIKINIIEG